MKDLVIITADADMKAVMEVVMDRPKSLGIRPINCEVHPNDGRDSALVKDGPELTRKHKAGFKRVLLLWDHHGCGRERLPPDKVRGDVQDRLNSVSWRDRSNAVTLVPELEEWVWHSPNAIRVWLERETGRSLTDGELTSWQNEFAIQQDRSIDQIRQELPKELLEFVCRRCLQRKPRVRDYDIIARAASLDAWRASTSFQAVTGWLQRCFPPS